VKVIFVFSGEPLEIEWLSQSSLGAGLEVTCGKHSRYRRVIKVAGVTESLLEDMLKPYYEAHDHEPLTILSGGAAIVMHLEATGSEADAKREIASREQELLAIFGDRIYGFDEDTMEAVIGRLLNERKATVAVAESCTGGLLASRITDVAGSSAYFMGGAVCYTGEAKTALAGVDPALIGDNGEVSEPVAIALAQGARERFGTTYGIGVTGIAGPGGGSEAKPVGTVHIAVAGPEKHEHRRLFWPMARPMFKWFATQSALDMLRRFMIREG
jgi:nicotinamide-nucleotide amidase